MLLSLARRASSVAATPQLVLRRPTPLPNAQRGLCSFATIQVDSVCRVFSCKVKNESGALDMDDLYQEMLDGLGEVPGCFGASRLVCKSEWDYKLIVKFEDAPSLTDFMKNEYTPLWVEQFKPQAEQLAVDGKIHEQNFVFDDIDE